MPRNVAPAMLAHLQSPVLTLALLVTITRADGLKIGFTSSDFNIYIGGVEHRPTDAVSVSAFQQTAGSGIDNAEAAGAITDDRVTDEDLAAGLWAGAEALVRVCNRHDMSAPPVEIMYGTVGQVQTADHKWTLELRGLGQRAKQKVGETTSPTCRCRRLGDARCGVDLTPFREVTAVEGPVGPMSFRVPVAKAKNPPADGDLPGIDYYERGIAKMVGGRNDGIEREIKSAVVAGGKTTIVLRTPFPFPVEAGDSVRLEAGCDRTIRCCRLKFSNAVRFRGEPDLPTNDTYLQVGRAPE